MAMPAEVQVSAEQLRERLFTQVQEFYELPSVYSQGGDPEVKRMNKLIAAEGIGSGLDQLAIAALRERGMLNSYTILTVVPPLRGGISLEAGFADPTLENGMLALKSSGEVANVEMLPIGAKRENDNATTYFPPKEDLVFDKDPSRVYLIKDMGVATGGTAAELIRMMISQGVDPRKIFVLGAIGTDTAQERIAGDMVNAYAAIGEAIDLEEAKKQVIFAVKGKMPIEADPQYMEHDAYYIKWLVRSNGATQEVLPQDWGDETNGTMKISAQINTFLDRLNSILLRYNGKRLTMAEKRMLHRHYYLKSLVE